MPLARLCPRFVRQDGRGWLVSEKRVKSTMQEAGLTEGGGGGGGGSGEPKAEGAADSGEGGGGGKKKKKGKGPAPTEQTWPEPTVPIADLFPNGNFPKGEDLQSLGCVSLAASTSITICPSISLSIYASVYASIHLHIHPSTHSPRDSCFRLSIGEEQEYKDCKTGDAGSINAYRSTAAELREKERLENDMYEEVREASEVHRTA